MERQNVAVLVFGDIGRSPRMQNHAMLLANYYNVSLVGDVDTPVFSEISGDKHITIVDLSSKVIDLARKTHIFIFYLFVRIIMQTLLLLWAFTFKLKSLKFVVVQNPPSIPVLSVMWLASLFKKFEVVVDFHNYGYTILGLKVKSKLILKIAQKYEKYFSRKCHKHLCVSSKMQENLKYEWGINAIVLRDGSTKRSIVELEQTETNQILSRVTGKQKGNNQLIIVSSTSWTKDEDFSILLHAVQKYEAEWINTLPNLRVYITGKGPQKESYQRYIQEKSPEWKHIEVKTLWLTHDDYPKFLACCDVGVCLHYSSSGLDLPMKVIDMFASGIPVLAINFQTIGELVLQPYNGYLFDDTEGLYNRIIELARNQKQIKRMADYLRSTRNNSFETLWEKAFSELRLLPKEK